MRQALVIILCFLFTNATFCQYKKITGINSLAGDTSMSYLFHLKLLDKLSLVSLDTLSTTEYYRIWTNKQVIEIWRNINDTVLGKLTTWADEYTSADELPTNRSFIKTKKFDTDTAKLIHQLILSSNILTLPTDDSIKGWKQGCDGIEYTIEQSNNSSYSFKTYWTPKAQDSLKEALLVQNFIDSIFNLSNAHKVWQDFFATIPFECFINGGPTIICKKIMTIKELISYKKERAKYRKSLHKKG